jgi:ribosome-binding factor A
MTEISRRSQKVASQIKENLSWVIEHQFRDPGKGFITLTKVRLSPDLKIANVYYSVLGESEDRESTGEALKRAKSYLRRELGNKIKLRFLPELRFYYDDSLDYSHKIGQLLNKIHKNENNQ